MCRPFYAGNTPNNSIVVSSFFLLLRSALSLSLSYHPPGFKQTASSLFSSFAYSSILRGSILLHGRNWKILDPCREVFNFPQFLPIDPHKFRLDIVVGLLLIRFARLHVNFTPSIERRINNARHSARPARKRASPPFKWKKKRSFTAVKMKREQREKVDLLRPLCYLFSLVISTI